MISPWTYKCCDFCLETNVWQPPCTWGGSKAGCFFSPFAGFLKSLEGASLKTHVYTHTYMYVRIYITVYLWRSKSVNTCYVDIFISLFVQQKHQQQKQPPDPAHTKQQISRLQWCFAKSPRWPPAPNLKNSPLNRSRRLQNEGLHQLPSRQGPRDEASPEKYGNIWEQFTWETQNPKNKHICVSFPNKQTKRNKFWLGTTFIKLSRIHCRCGFFEVSLRQ